MGQGKLNRNRKSWKNIKTVTKIKEELVKGMRMLTEAKKSYTRRHIIENLNLGMKIEKNQ